MSALSLRAEIFGMAVHFESNCTAVIECARVLTRSYRGGCVEAGAGELRVLVTVEDDAPGVITPLRYVDAGDGRLLLHSSAVAGVVEPLRRESVAWVSTSIVQDEGVFTSQVLEALALALIACFDRHPVHASTVEHAGRAFLLAGRSGAGKSTLAWMAHEAGFNVLTDDRTWVQLTPSLKVWGGPAIVRLADGTAAKHALALNAHAGNAVSHAHDASVCILGRGARPALHRISQAEALAHLQAQLAPGFDRFPNRHDQVMHALTTSGAWMLTLTSNPQDALPFLRAMLEAGQ